MGKKKKKELRVKKVEELKQINLNSAGIDIGDSLLYVSVPEDRDEKPVRMFNSFTRDLHDIVKWLKECQIETVAMESTGVYWVNIYHLLEKSGIEVYLVNARHAKNIPGRKTDILDCQWLRQLHTYGLLRSSFVPKAMIRTIRGIIRHRENLVRYRVSHVLHMQKALQLMNLKLTNVISSITGMSGLAIIRSIIAGERNPKILAEHRDPRCKNSKEIIAKSLEGNYHEEQIFALKQSLTLYDTYTQLIDENDSEIDRFLQIHAANVKQKDHLLPEPRGKKSRFTAKEESIRTALFQIVGVDITQIDGIQVLNAQTILSEIGTDMNKWPTVKHFTSWLCLCPSNKKTGGKVISSKTKRTDNRAHHAFKQAAHCVARSNCSLGIYYRRQRAKGGPHVAATNTAHKIARIVYHMIKNQTPFIPTDPNEEFMRYQERKFKQLQRQVKQFGGTIVLNPS